MPIIRMGTDDYCIYFINEQGEPCDKNGKAMTEDEFNFSIIEQRISHLFSAIVLHKPEIKEKILERIEKACQRIQNIHVFDESEG